METDATGTSTEVPSAKECGLCGTSKSLLDFPLRRGSPDGHHQWCFDCKRAKDREYSAQWRERNPEQRGQSARRYARKEGVRRGKGEQALLTKYGLTREAFAAKLAAQDGRCPLCPEGAPEPRFWAVDHDHSCCPGQITCGGCLRDILCQPHNAALGGFRDDPEQLRAAADYIERWHSEIQGRNNTPWSPKGMPSGPRHYNWKGNDATLGAIKQRVTKGLGQATACANGCTDTGRYEWVLRHGADPADTASYFSLCRKCSVTHYGQDGAGHANAKLTAAQADEIRCRYVRGQRPTQTELAREYGISVATVSLIIRGERYAAPSLVAAAEAPPPILFPAPAAEEGQGELRFA